MAYLEQEISRLLLGDWQEKYQAEAYQQALDRVRADLISGGARIQLTEVERLAAQGIQSFSATPSLGMGVSSAPIHRDALAFLYTRSFESLKGYTDDMAKKTRQILFGGVQQGKGINEVVREITDRIDVSKTRARLIARTETIQAYQQSSTNEAERISDEIGERVYLVWITAFDGRVRDLHAGWHGTKGTPEENRVRMSLSPWNCRCAQRAMTESMITKARLEKWKQQREKLLLLKAFSD